MEIMLPKPELPRGEQQIRIVTAEIRRVGEAKERTLEFVASDETRDRYKDIVMTDGWEYAAYKKNPVFLWGHSHHSLPIGRSVKTFIGSHPSKKNKEALIHHVQFAEKGNHYDDWPITTPTPETVYRMYTSEPRMLNAVSVGFMPLAYEPIMEKEGDKEYWTGGFKFTKQELLELSAVTVPANPSALIVNGFDAIGLRQADMLWLTGQCERILNSLKGLPDEDRDVVERWKEAVAKVRELRVEARTVSVPTQLLVTESTPAPVVEEAAPESIPAPVAEEAIPTVPSAEPIVEVAVIPAVVVEADPVKEVVRQAKTIKDLKEKLQEIMSICQELMDETADEEEEEEAAPVTVKTVVEPTIPKEPVVPVGTPEKTRGVDPDNLEEFEQQVDQVLRKLGVAGTVQSTQSAPTTSSQEMNPYALLLDATQSATSLLATLDK